MIIQYFDEFFTAFRKLSHSEKDAVLNTIDLFKDDPLNPSLDNHPLEKPMIGQRAILAGPDLRIIFREKGDYVEVLMLDVGNHSDVYLR